MISSTRRELLELGIASMALPALKASAKLRSDGISSGSYRNGRLKGYAIGPAGKRGPDTQYFEALAATGANVVRVFFPFRKCAACEQWGRNAQETIALRQILDWCRPRGIGVVVTGDFEGTDKPSFWQHTALRNSFLDNWRWFAETFGNDEALAGIDLLNEPNPPWPSGKVSEAHAQWRPLAAEAISALRKAGISRPVVFEGIGGGQAIGLRDFEPFNDSEVVYSFHMYTPHAITHQHVAPMWTRTIPYPAGSEYQVSDVVSGAGPWNKARLEESLKDVVSFQQRNRLPILVGEFSCVRWAPDGSAYRYISDCVSLFRKFGWSWCYHEFRGWPGWDAEIASESRTANLRTTSAPIQSFLAVELAKK